MDFHPRLRGWRPWSSREDRNPAAVFRAAVNGYEKSWGGSLHPLRASALSHL